MKIILLLSFLLSISVHGACTIGNLSFEVLMDKNFFDTSYDVSPLLFDNTSPVKILLKKEERPLIYSGEGVFKNDEAGNFEIEFRSTNKELIASIMHNHETWHYGLEGTITFKGQSYSLETVNDCSFNKLYTL